MSSKTSILGKFERLPSNVKPVLYELSLKPDLQTFKFSGQETVSIEIEQSVDKIVLNSVELNITNVRLSVNDQVLIPEIHLLKEEETLTLRFSNEVPVGKGKLFVEFNGELNDKMKGFYRAKYLKVAGEEDEYYAATQFESSDCRRCFPCWDEPAIKARFDITLDVDSTKVALSNMPIVDETPVENGRKRVKYARTPVMSTYLLAIVVGDFEFVEGTSSDGVLVRVYAPPGKKEKGKFALDIAIKALPYYKEYFHIAYPLPKLDLIAVSELSFGAMENWGLVTYSEQYLLVDEANTSALTKQDVALTVGHELAHMWFGNLVTMEWWTHLWLNEGYASFSEYLCVDHLFPDYDIWTQFATDAYFLALKLDALNSSHPIEVPVGRPSEVHEIFDEISYKKGASVIRMLFRYIGETDFKKGMNLYLTHHQYGNAFTEDLWAALEEASGKPVKAVMSTWTKQVGFPLINVEDCIQEDNSRVLILSQSRFCSENAKNNGVTSSWMIPISFCTKSSPDKECFSTTMETGKCKIVVPNVAGQDWIKLNQGTIGFYRVKYQPAHLLQFLPSIEDKTLPPLDRLGILDDLFALVQIGQATTSQVLNLIWSMRKEDNYSVWDTIVSCLGKIRVLLINMDCPDLLNHYGLQLMKHIYEQLGHENKANEPHLTSLHRDLILNQLIKFGATDFTDVMRKKLKQHCLGTDTLPANQRSIVYRTVLASDGRDAFNELIELYKKTNLEEEKTRILTAFSAIVDVHLVDDILKLTQRNDVITPNGAITAIISLASCKVGRVKAFNFVKDHYDELHDKYAGGFRFGRLIKYTFQHFSSEERAKEIENFLTTKNTSGVERVIQQSLESIRNNAAWLKRDGESIKCYLTDFKP